MHLKFDLAVPEISEIRDSQQLLRIPMYLGVLWEVNIIMNNELTVADLADQTNQDWFGGLCTVSFVRRTGWKSTPRTQVGVTRSPGQTAPSQWRSTGGSRTCLLGPSAGVRADRQPVEARPGDLRTEQLPRPQHPLSHGRPQGLQQQNCLL